MPDLDMLAYLPLFLNSLLDCLCDPFGEVRAQATKVLQVGTLSPNLPITRHLARHAVGDPLEPWWRPYTRGTLQLVRGMVPSRLWMLCCVRALRVVHSHTTEAEAARCRVPRRVSRR